MTSNFLLEVIEDWRNAMLKAVLQLIGVPYYNSSPAPREASLIVYESVIATAWEWIIMAVHDVVER